MKMIIAHLPNDAVETIRTGLDGLGVPRMALTEVFATSPRPPVTLRYRGAAMQTHLRAEMRFECYATDEQATAVIELLRDHAGPYGQIAVLDLAELHQQRSGIYSEDPRLDIALR